MADSHHVVETLKKLLKTQGLTYADVATRVGLSEASVKRLFSEETFTLKRLEDFCRLLEIDLYELAKLARGRTSEVREMTAKQEAALAAEPKLLGVFYLVLNEWQVPDIVAHYEISQQLLTRLLVRLDRLGLIDLLPGDKIRLKVPPMLRLRPGGPIETIHGKRTVGGFLAADFEKVGGYFRFECRELSTASFELLQRKLDRVATEFLELSELDSTLPSEERRTTGLALAMRPWAVSLVTGLPERKDKPAGLRPPQRTH
jgi:transcriptional regulator with XRE-family HTH domain